MANLTPDDIAAHTFSIEDRGYDRDEVRKFLFEVAARLRLAFHTTQPPVDYKALRKAATSSEAEVSAGANADRRERLGFDVSDVLRAAQSELASQREQAETIAEATRSEAEADAVEIRRKADADALWQHDRAKRVLIAAQEQSEAIISEAEAQAKAVLVGARDQAEQHAKHVAAQARRHAETILRAEREALHRLREAKSGLTTAIDVIGSAESHPVVDLTEYKPYIHLGEVSVEMYDASEPGEPNVQDPLVRMVRHAVDRAVSGAAEHAEESSDGAEVNQAGAPEVLSASPDSPAAV